MKITQKELDNNINNANVATEENLRKQLAYLYRIFDYYGWCDLIVTHLSVRVPNEDAFLFIPFGLTFKEVTPENLLKVDFNGNIFENESGLQLNKNGAIPHIAIYSHYKNVNCILHTHSTYGVVIANLEDDLMLLDQISMMFYDKVGYHDFNKLFAKDNAQEELIKDMEGKQAMVLKNHGLLTVGNTIADAFWYHYFLETTCKIQVLTMATGGKINFPNPEIVKSTEKNYTIWKDKNPDIPSGGANLMFEAAKREIGYIFG